MWSKYMGDVYTKKILWKKIYQQLLPQTLSFPPSTFISSFLRVSKAILKVLGIFMQYDQKYNECFCLVLLVEKGLMLPLWCAWFTLFTVSGILQLLALLWSKKWAWNINIFNCFRTQRQLWQCRKRLLQLFGI